MMRTALIAWDYPPSPSGLSTAAREIAESLGAAGCEAFLGGGKVGGGHWGVERLLCHR